MSTLWEVLTADQGLVILAVVRNKACVLCSAYVRRWLKIPNLPENLRRLGGCLIFISPLSPLQMTQTAKGWGWKENMGDVIKFVGDEDFAFSESINRHSPTKLTIGKWNDYGPSAKDGRRIKPQTTVILGTKVVQDLCIARDAFSSVARPDPVAVWNFVLLAVKAKQNGNPLPTTDIPLETMRILQDATLTDVSNELNYIKNRLLGGSQQSSLDAIME
eukprot:CAMPEP_0198316462 /NCGR_PEP_ID=MMETSP1450-20131203/6346_1 /TAXON_ID=753684 ORGANISM="Madagascaria erythrocladiodes, Strain CCMP3234" /NCGR_SAMPLE_ID=MMETSP1450 /ASSEMBLY_ACC=CAM_ASM_001115 /LENGTH=217 /DNA_ID=CAMNT_0044019621 /DNA_START=52 /DNA_END=705 /DNA_ORIENTATION=+